MGIVTKLQLILSIKSLIKDAIEEKGVEVGNSAFDLYPAKISEIGIEDDMTDINKVYYIDHTGYIHYKYTLEEFLELEEEPANPPFEGLIPTGWLMSLSDALAFVRANGFGPVIGLTYNTDDGTTRIYINIDDYSKTLTIYYSGLSTANKTKLKMDWGDGTSMSLSNNTAGSFTHTYALQGEYIIRYIPEDSTVAYIPNSIGSYSSIFGYHFNGPAYSLLHHIHKIEYGGNIQGLLGYVPMGINIQSISMPLGCSVSSLSGGPLYIFPSGGTTTISPSGFKLKNIIIPEGMTAFSSLSSKFNLNRIVLPSTITTFSALNSDVNLLAVNIPNGITSLPNNCFLNCHRIEKINLPNTITTIGTNAFQNCYNLKNINLPSNLTSLGTNAFQNCYNLSGTITIPEGVTSIGTYCFSSCSSLQKVIMHNNITSIATRAFDACTSLTEILFSNSLTLIPQYMAYNCYNLSGTLDIPEGVTSIGSNTFQNSIFKITEIIIPSTITSIGANAFLGSSLFTNRVAYIKAIVPPTNGSTIFGTIDQLGGKLKIYVPAESVDAYKTATNWATYASIIEAEPEESN